MQLTLRQLFDRYPMMKQRQFADLLPIHRVNFNEMVNGGKLSQWQLDAINEVLHKLGTELASIRIKHDNMCKGRGPYVLKDDHNDII